MIEIKLNVDQFEELVKKGYSLDMIYLLLIAVGEYDLLFSHNAKIANIFQTMVRKGLLTEEGKITLEGKDLLKFLENTEEKPKLKKKKDEDPFLVWWLQFPGTDSFEYKGKKFKGDRALRRKKDDCKAKIMAILNEGEHTIEDLIAALKLEIFQKKENSIKTGQNKMSYMQNSLTYLNQKTYEPYIELVKAGNKAEEEVKSALGGVEI